MHDETRTTDSTTLGDLVRALALVIEDDVELVRTVQELSRDGSLRMGADGRRRRVEVL